MPHCYLPCREDLQRMRKPADVLNAEEIAQLRKDAERRIEEQQAVSKARKDHMLKVRQPLLPRQAPWSLTPPRRIRSTCSRCGNPCRAGDHPCGGDHPGQSPTYLGACHGCLAGCAGLTRRSVNCRS